MTTKILLGAGSHFQIETDQKIAFFKEESDGTKKAVFMEAFMEEENEKTT